MVERRDTRPRDGHTEVVPPAPERLIPEAWSASRPAAPAAAGRWPLHPYVARKRARWWLLLAFAAALLAFAADLYGLLDDRRVNAMLERSELGFIAERDTARGQLARAYRLHAGGRLAEALEAYGAIPPDAEPELRSVQHFNLGNLYLERAVEFEAKDETQAAVILVELAKQNYREVLARDPHHWDAKYNLSRALEMLPDVGAVDYEDEFNPERSPQAPQAARSYEGLP